jgi:Spy/CpxP family protein refolding chaperone
VQGFAPQRPPVEQALGAQSAEGRWWNKQRMIDQLKLTDDQRKAMDQIFYDHRARLIDLQATLKKAELAMQPLMAADQPDTKALSAQIDKVVAARGELERANAHFLLDIRAKLSPEQWKQVKQIRANPGAGAAAPAPPAMQQWRNQRRNQTAPPPPGAAPAPQGPPPAGPGAGPGTGLEQ